MSQIYTSTTNGNTSRTEGHTVYHIPPTNLPLIQSIRGNTPLPHIRRRAKFGRSRSVVKVVLWSRGGSHDEARLEQTPYPF